MTVSFATGFNCFQIIYPSKKLEEQTVIWNHNTHSIGSLQTNPMKQQYWYVVVVVEKSYFIKHRVIPAVQDTLGTVELGWERKRPRPHWAESQTPGEEEEVILCV